MATEHKVPYEGQAVASGDTVASSRFSRRALIKSTLALGSSAALTLLDACGSSASGNHASITYWNLFGGGDGVGLAHSSLCNSLGVIIECQHITHSGM